MAETTYCRAPGISENTRQDSTPVTYEELYDQFMNLTPDPAGVSIVKNLRLQRDVGMFDLHQGKLYLCKPIRGRVCAALFEGEGTFSFKPPTYIEQQQLYRFYEKDSLEEKFSTLFIIFADTTLEELNRSLSFATGDIPLTVPREISYCMEYMGNPDGKNFNPEIMKTFLDDTRNSLFYSHFSFEKLKPLFFEINPYEVEEVRFMRRVNGDFMYTREVVNQFHTREEYTSKADLTDEDKSEIRVESYTIDEKIKDVNEIHELSNAAVNFKYLIRNQSWIYFWLSGEVDSVVWGNNKKAVFFHEHHNPLLWVRCDTPIQLGTATTRWIEINSLHRLILHFIFLHGLPSSVSGTISQLQQTMELQHRGGSQLNQPAIRRIIMIFQRPWK